MVGGAICLLDLILRSCALNSKIIFRYLWCHFDQEDAYQLGCGSSRFAACCSGKVGRNTTPQSPLILWCSFLEVWLSRKLKFFRDMAWRKRQGKQHACGGLPNWPLPKGKPAAIDVNSMLSLLCSAEDCCTWCFLNEYIIWVKAVMDQSRSAFYSHFTCCFKDFCIDWCWQNCAGLFLAQVLRLQLPHAICNIAIPSIPVIYPPAEKQWETASNQLLF